MERAKIETICLDIGVGFLSNFLVFWSSENIPNRAYCNFHSNIGKRYKGFLSKLI